MVDDNGCLIASPQNGVWIDVPLAETFTIITSDHGLELRKRVAVDWTKLVVVDVLSTELLIEDRTYLLEEVFGLDQTDCVVCMSAPR